MFVFELINAGGIVELKNIVNKLIENDFVINIKEVRKYNIEINTLDDLKEIGKILDRNILISFGCTWNNHRFLKIVDDYLD